jgi:hypothetical protein
MKTICLTVILLLCHLNISPAVLKYFTPEEFNVPTYEVYNYNLDYKLNTYNYNIYIDILGRLESSNNYEVTNQFGYLGKYQFSKRTLRSLYKKDLISFNIDEVGSERFLKSKKMQEEAIKALTESNMAVIINYGLLNFRFNTVDGVFITNEGMLAASHLLGPKSVKLFLESDGKINKKDGNGTSVKDYLSKYQFIYN